MSYEGYTEFLCEKGHRSVVDCYERDPTTCGVCQGKLTHRHSVDCTNGVVRGDPGTRNAPVAEIGVEDYTATRKLYKPLRHWQRL